mmetsp:Transcript_28897/g.85385  ORF Transcript_28897/g.85385 Transcript_28897/m.85385 type:complete len:252 (+) Transcript_28897:1033-1788(+)
MPSLPDRIARAAAPLGRPLRTRGAVVRFARFGAVPLVFPLVPSDGLGEIGSEFRGQLPQFGFEAGGVIAVAVAVGAPSSSSSGAERGGQATSTQSTTEASERGAQIGTLEALHSSATAEETSSSSSRGLRILLLLTDVAHRVGGRPSPEAVGTGGRPRGAKAGRGGEWRCGGEGGQSDGGGGRHGGERLQRLPYQPLALPSPRARAASSSSAAEAALRGGRPPGSATEGGGRWGHGRGCALRRRLRRESTA